jgi:hypothetical protein
MRLYVTGESLDAHAMKFSIPELLCDAAMALAVIGGLFLVSARWFGL